MLEVLKDRSTYARKSLAKRLNKQLKNFDAPRMAPRTRLEFQLYFHA